MGLRGYFVDARMSHSAICYEGDMKAALPVRDSLNVIHLFGRLLESR